MDYIFFETYYANNDWPDNNAICYKTKGEKWKWLLNDLDFSLAYPGEQNVSLNMFDRLRLSNSVHAVLFNKLCTNETFKTEFKERANQNIKTHLNPSRIRETYTDLKKMYDAEIQKQIDRWRNIGSVEEWEENCQRNLEFLLTRKNFYHNHLEAL
jgi:CotH kinase protein